MDNTITVRPGVGNTGRIVQRQALRVAQCFIEQPTLVVIQNGSKHLAWAGGECLLNAGQAFVIAGGQRCDVTNRPGRNGQYEAFWLGWDASLFDGLPTAQAGCAPISDLLVIRPPDPAFVSACQQACAAVRESDAVPVAVAQHRMRELLAWIEHFGGYFVTATSPSLMRRVWGLLGSDPGRDWNTDAVAQAMAMSEATLRRRLATEGSKLSELLVDVRMTRALQLLQSTGLPINQIALEVGYASASRFAIRFRQRFGFAPTAIRGDRAVLRIPDKQGANR
ncbi:MAG: AraC family transcriptional regulator [Azonexus sp.]|jgi:AraC-like DNA-binding protein|uniref:helix-turn-helix transcriptional regulator n=1 Tax=Azonexus sp. TaxID=1872668 RepID=UPI002819F192|nr:AraC family transcriptional regulator [Azonexus sp.]MDR0775737.1 AraC family transcriptional regulator [Azonexus sp.]